MGQHSLFWSPVYSADAHILVEPVTSIQTKAGVSFRCTSVTIYHSSQVPVTSNLVSQVHTWSQSFHPELEAREWPIKEFSYTYLAERNSIWFSETVPRSLILQIDIQGARIWRLSLGVVAWASTWTAILNLHTLLCSNRISLGTLILVLGIHTLSFQGPNPCRHPNKSCKVMWIWRDPSRKTKRG